MAAATSKTQKQSKSPSKKQAAGSRKLKQSGYASFKLSKRMKHPGGPVKGSFALLKAALRHVVAHKKVFAGITVVNLLLVVFLVRGFVFTEDLNIAKQAVEELVSGSSGKFTASFTILGMIVSSGSASTDVALLYQTIIVILVSLAVIWALRQTHAGEVASVKSAFYKSTYPLVPFLFVLFVVGLQLIPFLAANFLYGATIASGLATTAIEQLLWLILVFLLIVWSLYMITASIFAMYIVTLPDMTPIKALKSARGLVQYRRWEVMRKLLFLPIITVIIGVILLVPIVMFLTPVAEPVFLVFSSSLIVLAHAYVYGLYKELLA